MAGPGHTCGVRLMKRRVITDTGGGKTTQRPGVAQAPGYGGLGPGGAGGWRWGGTGKQSVEGRKTGGTPGCHARRGGLEGEQAPQSGEAGELTFWSGGPGLRGPLGQPREAAGPVPAPRPGPAAAQPGRGCCMPSECRASLLSSGQQGARAHVRLSHPPSRVQGLGHSTDDFCRNQSGQLQAPGQRGPCSGVAEVQGLEPSGAGRGLVKAWGP